MAACTFQDGGVNQLWSTSGNWVDGSVPVSGDAVTIPVGTVCVFDVDQSGFAVGLSTVTVNGTLRVSTTPGAYYMKLAFGMVGDGIFEVGSLDTPYPMTCTFIVRLIGDQCISLSNTGRIRIYGSNPVYAYLRLSSPAAIGQTVLSVDTDVTGTDAAWWATGRDVHVDGLASDGWDANNTSEHHTIDAITASTVTLTTGLARAKAAGSYVVLLWRNVTISSATDGWAVLYGFQHHIDCYIDNRNIGYMGSSVIAGIVHGATTVGGIDNIVSSYITSGKGYDSSGFGMNNSTFTGIVTGTDFGVIYTQGSRLNGAIVQGCRFGYWHNIGLIATASTVSENSIEYVSDGRNSTRMVSFVDKGVPNATLMYSPNGTMTRDETGVFAAELPRYPSGSHKFTYIIERDLEPTYMEWDIVAPRGTTVNIPCYAKHDTTGLSATQRLTFHLVDPSHNPWTDPSNDPLDSWTASDVNTVQTMMLTATPTTDVPLLLRVFATRASGNAWVAFSGDAMQSAYPLSDVAGSTWLNESGSGSNLALSIGEAVPSDTNYIRSGATGSETAIVALCPLATPTAGTVTIRLRARKTTA